MYIYIYIIWGHWNLKETAMLVIFVASRLAGLSLASPLFRFTMVFLRIVQCQGSRPTSEAVHSWKPRWSIWKETHDSPLFFPTSMGATYRNSSLGKVIRSSVHSNAQVLSVGFARDMTCSVMLDLLNCPRQERAAVAFFLTAKGTCQKVHVKRATCRTVNWACICLPDSINCLRISFAVLS